MTVEELQPITVVDIVGECQAINSLANWLRFPLECHGQMNSTRKGILY